MLQFLKNVLKRQSPKPSAGVDKSALLDDIPRYPPFMKGLPVADVSDVLQTQSELVGKARNVLGYPQAEFEGRVMPVLQRYAAFVHLLPASEAHHHRGAGGLLRHGLEVAFWAAQSSEAYIFPFDGPPRSKAAHEARWRFAAFMAGLCHDIGKPISDMEITDKSGQHTWRPFRESLVPWAQQIGAERYFVRWRDARVHKRHELLTRNIFELVAGRESLDYLDEFDHRVLPSLLQAIGGVTGLSEPLTKVVMRADQESVKRDLTRNRMNIDEHSYGVPVERYVFDAMRTLVNNGTWPVNVAGAKVWVLNEGVFIVWKLAVKDITKAIQDAGVPGVPRDADTLADVLIERGYALPNSVTTEDGEIITYRYWQIEPSIPQTGGVAADAKFQVLRLDDVDTLFTNAVPAIIGGTVFEAGQGEQLPASSPAKTKPESELAGAGVPTEPSQSSAEDKTGKAKRAAPKSKPIPAKSSPAPAPATAAESPPGVPPADAPPNAPEASPYETENPDHIPAELDAVMAMLRQTEPPVPELESSPPVGAGQPEADANPSEVTSAATLSVSIPGDTPQADSAGDRSTSEDTQRPDVETGASRAAAVPRPPALSVPSQPITPLNAQEPPSLSATARLHALLDQLGPEAVQLRQVIDPVLNGAQTLGPVLLRVNGEVVIRYPKGLSALGEPSKVLIDLHAAGLVMSDPVMPGKKVQNFDGVTAVVLPKTLSRAIIAALGEAEAAADPFGQTQAASGEKPRSAVDKPKRKGRKAKSQAEAPAATQLTIDAVDDAPTATPLAENGEDSKSVLGRPRPAAPATPPKTPPELDEHDMPYMPAPISSTISEEEFFRQGEPDPEPERTEQAASVRHPVVTGSDMEDEHEEEPAEPVKKRPEPRNVLSERVVKKIDHDFAPKKITAKEAIDQLQTMMHQGHGRWLAGPVTDHGKKLSCRIDALDLIALEYPHCLSKTQLRMQILRNSGSISNGQITLFRETQ